jgi:hypothetical protein
MEKQLTGTAQRGVMKIAGERDEKYGEFRLDSDGMTVWHRANRDHAWRPVTTKCQVIDFRPVMRMKPC